MIHDGEPADIHPQGQGGGEKGGQGQHLVLQDLIPVSGSPWGGLLLLALAV